LKPKFYDIQAEDSRKEKAVLVGMAPAEASPDGTSTLDELSFLADTAGAEVVARILQRHRRIDPATFIGKGKLEELKAACERAGAELIIFDDELNPAQLRNLEKSAGARVIDRTELVLDIFAKRAKTREAMIQVEKAQLEYLLPRLTRMWVHLSRLGGGIGTRGPGETQLEVDRRRIREKLSFLKKKLASLDTEREVQRKKRSSVFSICIVGYTNVGKSTLFNYVTRSQVFTEDKLFATLDPTTRRLTLPNKKEVLITDTVGFIQKLPTTVVAAFRATLEELEEAALLLHIIDITHQNAVEQSITVEKLLTELGLGETPRITVLNKIDLIAPSEEDIGDFASAIKDSGQEAVLISAAKGWGLEGLLERIGDKLSY